MHRTKGVLDEETDPSDETGSRGRVVLRLSRVETGVLEDGDLATALEPDLLLGEPGHRVCHRAERKDRIGAFRSAEM